MHDKLGRIAPYATIVILLVVSYFALFHSGNGFMQTASAQTQPGRIGEAITDTVTGAAAEHSGDIAEVEAELDSPASMEEETEPAGPPEIDEADLPPGESAELGVDAGGQTVIDIREGTPYYTNAEGVGGNEFIEMDEDEIRLILMEVDAIMGSEAIVNSLMPLVLRFQEMVSPPVDPRTFGENPPWTSESRRYSPFDPVGIQGGPIRRSEAVPPFRNPLPGIDVVVDQPEINAEMVAQSISLVGVIGEPGSYQAILTAFGYERRVAIGDEVITISEKTYIISDISLLNIIITDNSNERDTAVIPFIEQERAGIAEMSFSY